MLGGLPCMSSCGVTDKRLLSLAPRVGSRLSRYAAVRIALAQNLSGSPACTSIALAWCFKVLLALSTHPLRHGVYPSVLSMLMVFVRQKSANVPANSVPRSCVSVQGLPMCCMYSWSTSSVSDLDRMGVTCRWPVQESTKTATYRYCPKDSSG